MNIKEYLYTKGYKAINRGSGVDLIKLGSGELVTHLQGSELSVNKTQEQTRELINKKLCIS